MTTTVTSLTEEVLRSGEDVGLRIDLVASGLLLLLTMEYGLLRTYYAPRTPTALRAFAIPVVALAVSFVFIIAARWRELR